MSHDITPTDRAPAHARLVATPFQRANAHRALAEWEAERSPYTTRQTKRGPISVRDITEVFRLTERRRCRACGKSASATRMLLSEFLTTEALQAVVADLSEATALPECAECAR